MTYENIYQRRPQRFEFFVDLLSHGTISCSSTFSSGYILILSKVSGSLLIDQWSRLLASQKVYVYSQFRKAVEVLRAFSVLSVDCGQHNVLSVSGGGTTFLDRDNAACTYLIYTVLLFLSLSCDAKISNSPGKLPSTARTD